MPHCPTVLALPCKGVAGRGGGAETGPGGCTRRRQLQQLQGGGVGPGRPYQKGLWCHVVRALF